MTPTLRTPPHSARRARGFTLTELMITVAIVGILLSVALPSYQSQVVRTRRAAASACLMEMAQFMERVYASNVRYDQNNGASTTLPNTACRSDLSASYSIGFASGQPQQRTFTLLATPQGQQATRDTACGTLGIDQANVKSVTGSSTVANCWK